ncbi:MAG: cytochrome C554 [Deltaproteobacteria bacterium]|nr:cytochrome C554 [Candidatus Zymogenaceae bacterium]
MKKHLPLLTVSLLFIAGIFLLSFTDLPTYPYEGSSRCSLCHSTAEIGGQYEIWFSSAHRRALSDLSSEKGAAIAEEKGIKKPADDPNCLSCHLTGYDAPFNLLGPLYKRQDGVSCEGCHGAGGGYAFFSIMYDEKKAVSKGLIVHPGENCTDCHDGKAHTMPPFDPDRAIKAIAHPIPGRIKAR